LLCLCWCGTEVLGDKRRSSREGLVMLGVPELPLKYR
jgi:hypothetical protein